MRASSLETVSFRAHEEIDVFRKALDEVPGFRETGSALEDDSCAEARGNEAQGLGHPIVLFDDGCPGAGRLTDRDKQVDKVVPLVEHYRAPQLRAAGSTASGPKS